MITDILEDPQQEALLFQKEKGRVKSQRNPSCFFQEDGEGKKGRLQAVDIQRLVLKWRALCSQAR